MVNPVFGAGQRVTVSELGRLTTPGGVYKIVRVVPAEGGPVQYRIKSEAEPFERIIEESRLTEVSHG